MTIKVRLSMKVKLLLIFSSLTLFAVGTNLYFGIKMFSADKSASILVNSSNSASFLTKQFENFIDSNYQRARIYGLSSLSSEGDLKKILPLNKDLLSFQIYDNLDAPTAQKLALYNEGVLSQLFEGDEQRVKAFKSEPLFEILKKNSFNLISEKLVLVDTTELVATPSVAILTKGPNSKFLVVLLSLAEMRELFEKDKTYKSYLIDSNKKTILSSGDVLDPHLSNIFWKDKNKTVTDKTKEVEDSNGVTYLASYNYIGPLDYMVVTKIEKNKAMKALNDLVKDSLAISIVLLSISMILSVLFSNSLSRPLKNLLRGTRQIAKGEYGHNVEVKSTDEVSEVAESFNHMSCELSKLMSAKEKAIKQLQNAKAKLENYSQNLANMVEERTAKLNQANEFMDTMLNSLGQGLMVFNRNNDIHDMYTKACDQIFENKPHNNKISSVLGIEGEEEIYMFQKWSNNLFKELIPFEHLVGLGPQFYTNKFPESDPNFRYIGLEYYPMRGEDGKIENVVCVATDKTGEYLARKAMQAQENYTNMISKVVLGKGQFAIFVNEFKLIMKDLLLRVTRETLNLDLLMRHFHTIKGGASLFSLGSLVATAHEAESYISSHKKELLANDKNARNGLHSKVNAVSRSFKEIILELRDYVGESLEDGQKRIEVKYPLLQEFQEKLLENNYAELANEFQNEFLMEPAIRYFKGYNSLVQDLSKKLGKLVNPIIFEDNGIKVYAEEFNEFFSVLVHVFRNIVDHGIENPDDRVAKGKSKHGNVLIRFSRTIFNGKDSLIVQIQDDGRGIDPDRIRKTMMKLSYPQDIINKSDEKIVYHIFDENFSSADTITDLSGRGVGMSAIKKVIEKQGGAINIKTVLNKGVSFNFCINGTVSDIKG